MTNRQAAIRCHIDFKPINPYIRNFEAHPTPLPIMKNILTLSALALSISMLSGCGALTEKEIARLPVNEVSTDEDHLMMQETTLYLKKGEQVGVWSEIDIEYEGNIGLRFRLDIYKGDEPIAEGMEIDPMEKNITLGETKISVNGKVDWSFTGRNTSLTFDEDGEYTFKAILVASNNPTLKINQAELVLKQ